MKKIRNIILDLGGVLLRVDYDAPVREFRKLGIENFHQLFAQASQSVFIDDFEKGKISNEEFRNRIRSISGRSSSDEEIDAAWNSILLEMPAHKMELLGELKKKYRLFLLSNTNAIHIPCFEKRMEQEYGKYYFHSHFEKIYYSSEAGMRKPDAEIFQKVLNEQQLDPEETVFIDDSAQHVKGAEQCGILAFHLDLKKSDLRGLLEREQLI